MHRAYRRRPHRRRGRLQDRSAQPLADEIRQARRGVRSKVRHLRLRDPVFQHDELDGPIAPQRAPLLRSVRARGHRRSIRDKIAGSKRKPASPCTNSHPRKTGGVEFPSGPQRLRGMPSRMSLFCRSTPQTETAECAHSGRNARASQNDVRLCENMEVHWYSGQPMTNFAQRARGAPRATQIGSESFLAPARAAAATPPRHSANIIMGTVNQGSP